MTAASARTRSPDRPMTESEREMQMRGMQAAHPQPGAETKPAVRTSEFYIYLAAVVGVLLASLLVGQRGGDDIFPADQAWWFISLLTIGYLISRGLAKAGSSHRSMSAQR
jgi:hypothetical protein